MAAQSKAAIVAAARTAIGTARKGTLANMPPIELAKPIVAAADRAFRPRSRRLRRPGARREPAGWR